MALQQLAELEPDHVHVAADDAVDPGTALTNQLVGEDGDLDIGAVVAGDGDDVAGAVGSGAVAAATCPCSRRPGCWRPGTDSGQAGVVLVELDDDHVGAGGAEVAHELQVLATQSADDDVVLAPSQPEGFPLLPEQDAQGLQGRAGRE